MDLELKSTAEINKMKQAELREYSIAITSAFSAINSRLDKMEGLLTITTQTNSTLVNEVKRLNNRIVTLERQAVNDGQYARKRQIELWNLDPKIVKSADLKDSAAALLSLTGVKVAPHDIDVAHPMKKPGQVIVELKSATTVYNILTKRKNLKHKQPELSDVACPKLSIVESMTFQYKKLDFACRKLAKARKIQKTFFFNRKLHLVTNDGTHKLIGHMADLIEIFDEKTISELFDAPKQPDARAEEVQ